MRGTPSTLASARARFFDLRDLCGVRVRRPAPAQFAPFKSQNKTSRATVQWHRSTEFADKREDKTTPWPFGPVPDRKTVSLHLSLPFANADIPLDGYRGHRGTCLKVKPSPITLRLKSITQSDTEFTLISLIRALFHECMMIPPIGNMQGNSNQASVVDPGRQISGGHAGVR